MEFTKKFAVLMRANPATWVHPPVATISSGAEAIIKTTYMRDRELYFPDNQNLFMTAAMRILAPSWIDAQIEEIKQK